MPHLNIYEKYYIDVEHLGKTIESFLIEANNNEVFLLIDTPFIHEIGMLFWILWEKKIILNFSARIRQLALNMVNVKVLQLDMDIDYSKSGLYIFIGNNNKKMENIIFSLDGKLSFYSIVEFLFYSSKHFQNETFTNMILQYLMVSLPILRKIQLY